jgi:hypothetical protein
MPPLKDRRRRKGADLSRLASDFEHRFEDLNLGVPNKKPLPPPEPPPPAMQELQCLDCGRRSWVPQDDIPMRDCEFCKIGEAVKTGRFMDPQAV